MIKRLQFNRTAKQKKRIYDATDIARYVIKYCNEQYTDISHMKLQKLLYFIQAFFLVEIEKGYGYPAFSDRIEAWESGPVVPAVYEEFKLYGALPNIPHKNSYLIPDPKSHWSIKRVNYDDSMISEHNKKGIIEIVDYFKDWATNDLVKLTHRQEPWENAYSHGANTEIKTKEIKEYFSE